MSSSVFFRFKSQKEPTRVAFDGTGISVFELKRAIITTSRLGDGTDFELIVSSEDSNEVYNDDTTVIPRSTTVVAKRLPAAKAGRGGAARYVSGKMPANAKNSHRIETSQPRSITKMQPNDISHMSTLQTEEERIAAMFKLGADQWEQQQQEMAQATPVHRTGPLKGKPISVPDRPPPPGYVCYRCGEKGHWIQVCPTNDDPNFEGRPRIKRTTGIPRSFLKTVEKPSALTDDSSADDSKKPSGVMVNAEGEWVIAEPDKASWEQYQAKAKVSAAAQEAAAKGNRDLQSRGLECPIDKRLFVDPTKTPCCQTTYCKECITNALLDNDFQCPGCSTEGVLIEKTEPDTEMAARIKAYEATILTTKEVQENTSKELEGNTSVSMTPTDTLKVPGSDSAKTTHKNPKKRGASTKLESDRPSPALENKTLTADATTKRTQNIDSDATKSTHPNPGSLPATTASSMNGLQHPTSNGFMTMPVSMSSLMDINMMNSMMNPMLDPMMNPMNIANGQFSAMNGNGWNNLGYPQPTNGMYGMNGFLGPTPYGQPMIPLPMSNNFVGPSGLGDPNTQGMRTFANQQRSSLGTTSGTNDEDGAYFRKPVNPHRHQGRRNVNRPTDYREI